MGKIIYCGMNSANTQKCMHELSESREELEEHKKKAIGSNFVYLKKRRESGK
jgi:hypothetical protein